MLVPLRPKEWLHDGVGECLGHQQGQRAKLPARRLLTGEGTGVCSERGCLHRNGRPLFLCRMTPAPSPTVIVPGATDRRVNPHTWGRPTGLTRLLSRLRTSATATTDEHELSNQHAQTSRNVGQSSGRRGPARPDTVLTHHHKDHRKLIRNGEGLKVLLRPPFAPKEQVVERHSF